MFWWIVIPALVSAYSSRRKGDQDTFTAALKGAVFGFILYVAINALILFILTGN